MTHLSALIKRMFACSNIYPSIIQRQRGMQVIYRWEGALSQYFAKLEVLWLFLAWLRGLDGWLCAYIWALAAGRCSYSTSLCGWALHAGTVTAACAWDSKWRAGVRVVSYHWWMWAGTDDNVGLNGHNIILKQDKEQWEYRSVSHVLQIFPSLNQSYVVYIAYSPEKYKQT